MRLVSWILVESDMTWKEKAHASLDPIAVLLDQEPIDWRALEEASKTLAPLLETHPGTDHYVHPTGKDPVPDPRLLHAVDQIELLQPALLRKDLAAVKEHLHGIRELLRSVG
jgi:hypothetical protein